MTEFVDAYDTRTGRKLPHLVPEARLDHPVWGRYLARTPRSKAPAATTSAASLIQTSAAPVAGSPVNTIPVNTIPVDTTSAPQVGDDDKENSRAEDDR